MSKDKVNVADAVINTLDTGIKICEQLEKLGIYVAPKLLTHNEVFHFDGDVEIITTRKFSKTKKSPTGHALEFETAFYGPPKLRDKVADIAMPIITKSLKEQMDLLGVEVHGEISEYLR